MNWITIIAALFKILGPLISGWFASRGQTALGPDAAASAIATTVGAWSAIGTTSWGIGEWIQSWGRRQAAGPIGPDVWKKIIELILQIIQAWLTPEQVRQVNAMIASQHPDAAQSLGIRR